MRAVAYTGPSHNSDVGGLMGVCFPQFLLVPKVSFSPRTTCGLGTYATKTNNLAASPFDVFAFAIDGMKGVLEPNG